VQGELAAARLTEGLFGPVSVNPFAPSGHLPLHKGGFRACFNSGNTKGNWEKNKDLEVWQ